MQQMVGPFSQRLPEIFAVQAFHIGIFMGEAELAGHVQLPEQVAPGRGHHLSPPLPSAPTVFCRFFIKYCWKFGVKFDKTEKPAYNKRR